MERKISLGDLQKTVEEAYENYKSEKDGQIAEGLDVQNPKAFGISVVLTDGTVVNKGDTAILSPLGDIAKIPTATLLLTQYTPEQIVSKSGCGCKCDKGDKKKVGICVKGLRAVSAVEPQNDPDGKWDLMINNIINLMGSAPVLDDKLYEALSNKEKENDTLQAIADAQITLLDKPETSLMLFTKLISLQATAEQIATMGATIAADGVNPKNGSNVFDGSIAANVVAMAARGPKKAGKCWMMEVGLPAKSSFGGMILAILPGFGAIAAYSPELDEKGLSVKAAKAIQYVANKLQLNVYASARVKVEK